MINLGLVENKCKCIFKPTWYMKLRARGSLWVWQVCRRGDKDLGLGSMKLCHWVSGWKDIVWLHPVQLKWCPFCWSLNCIQSPGCSPIASIPFFLNLFIYLFLAVLGLCFCARAFSSCSKRGPLFIAVCRPLTIAASLVAEHRLQTRRLSSCGSRA